MNFTNVLRDDEKIIFGLRELYSGYGYSQYQMNKFEEYDLYVKNKDFLVSENIITFTDTNGKLMALKPDVTLSIIKNREDNPESLQKVYYHENVYRVSGSTKAFREILQVGLECIGNIDSYCIYEVLTLAAKSLFMISDDCMLDISHLGAVSDAIAEIGCSPSTADKLLKCVGEKNIHGISDICRQEGIDEEKAAFLKALVATYGSPATVIPKLEGWANEYNSNSLRELISICKALLNCGFADKMHIDFSVINDMSYYNGIVFKGFIKGVPMGILSGGQYDKLMKKMGKRSRALGFAVYLDMLERLWDNSDQYDVDVVLLYDESTDVSTLDSKVSAIRSEGVSVTAQKAIPQNLRYRKLLKIKNGEVISLENNA